MADTDTQPADTDTQPEVQKTDAELRREAFMRDFAPRARSAALRKAANELIDRIERGIEGEQESALLKLLGVD